MRQVDQRGARRVDAVLGRALELLGEALARGDARHDRAPHRAERRRQRARRSLRSRAPGASGSAAQELAPPASACRRRAATRGSPARPRRRRRRSSHPPVASTLPGAPRPGSHAGAPDLERSPCSVRRRAGRRAEARAPRARARPPAATSRARASSLVDLARVGHALRGLRQPRCARPASSSRQRRDDHVRAERGELVVQRCPRRRRRAIGSACRGEHRPGIEARVHPHDGDPGFAVAGKKRALDRRRAAPARQQRGMNVERAVAARASRNCRRQQQRRRRRRPAHPAAPRAHALRLGRAEARGLEHREAARERELLDRARRRLACRGRPAGRAA